MATHNAVLGFAPATSQAEHTSLRSRCICLAWNPYRVVHTEAFDVDKVHDDADDSYLHARKSVF